MRAREAVIVILAAATAVFGVPTPTCGSSLSVLTLHVYDCAAAGNRPPELQIAPASIREGGAVRNHDHWTFRVLLPSGYFAIAAKSARCGARTYIAMLPHANRVVALFQSASAGAAAIPTGGALAGVLPVPGLRVFVSNGGVQHSNGSWATVDGRHFYSEHLEPGGYRIVSHFGNCCGFVQEATVYEKRLTVVRLDLSHYYAQAVANLLAQATLYELTAAQDGTLWFAEYLGVETRLGHFYPDGNFAEYDIKGARNVTAITPRPDGSVWFIRDGSVIERLGDAGKLTTVLADPSQSFSQLVFSADGSLWLTGMSTSSVTHARADGSNQHTYKLPFVEPGEENARLTSSADGAVWYSSLGGNRIFRFGPDQSFKQIDLAWNCGPFAVKDLGNKRIFSCWDGEKGAGTVEPAGFDPTRVHIPGNADRMVSFTALLDGRLWFIDRSAQELIGLNERLDQRIIHVAAADDAFNLVSANGALWFVNETQNQIVSVDPGGPVATHPVPPAPKDPAGLPSLESLVPDLAGNVWFTLRHEMALYCIDRSGTLRRFALAPRSVKAFK